MASYHCSVKRGTAPAKAHFDYIYREGKYEHAKDVEDLEFKGHGNLPEWAEGDPGTFWEESDKYERAGSSPYREEEVALPNELTPEERERMVKEYMDKNYPDHPYTYAGHNGPAANDPEQTQTHVHIMISARKNDGIERSKEQYFKQYNSKHPERGGAKREDKYNQRNGKGREEVRKTREEWERKQNEYLERGGHEARVDCRTLKEQRKAALEKGDHDKAQELDRPPEEHLGPRKTRNKNHPKNKEMWKLRDLKREMRELLKELKRIDREIERQLRYDPVAEFVKKLKQIFRMPPEIEYPPNHWKTARWEERMPTRERVPVKQVRNELNDYLKKYVHSTVPWAEKTLQQLDQVKNDLPGQYRQEAAEVYVNRMYADQVKELGQAGKLLNQEIQAFNARPTHSQKEYEDITRRYNDHNYKCQNLKEYMERDKQEISYGNLNARFDGYKIKEFIDQYTRERDPNYDNKVKAIDAVKAEIQEIQKEASGIGKVVRELETKLRQVKDQDKEIGMTSPYIAGQRLTLADIRGPKECLAIVQSIGSGTGGHDLGKNKGLQR